MFTRIAVFDPLPVFRRGVLATLGETGFDAETPDDLLAWARGAERRLVVLTLSAPDAWGLLAEIRQVRPGTEVMAVLDDPSVAGYVRALAAGAVGAVPRDASPSTMREAFEAVLRGRSVLPIEVLRVLSSGAAPLDPLPDQLTAQELGWLRELARGSTIVQLAETAGYSERMMFRLLRGAYRKLNAASRTEAMMTARARGLL